MITVHIQEKALLPFHGIDSPFIAEQGSAVLSLLHYDSDLISVILCTDEEIHKVNREYRDRDYPTDVISFAYNEEPFPGDEEENYTGDIFISLDRAYAQSQEYNVSLVNEISRLLVHSILHLYGYDHEGDEKEAEIMYAKEDELLKKILPQ